MIPSIGPLDRLYLNEFSIYDLLLINVLKAAENSSAIVSLFEFIYQRILYNFVRQMHHKAFESYNMHPLILHLD